MNVPGDHLKDFLLRGKLTQLDGGGEVAAVGHQLLLLAVLLHGLLAPHVPPHVLPQDGADHLDNADLVLQHAEEDTGQWREHVVCKLEFGC